MQDFKHIYSAFGRVLAIDDEGEIWSFYDRHQWFVSGIGYDVDQEPQQKTSLMKLRKSKAIDLSLRLHLKDKNFSRESPREAPTHVMLVVKRQRAITDSKTEESFECIPQRNFEATDWATKVTFNYN